MYSKLFTLCFFLFLCQLGASPDGHGGYAVVEVRATQTNNPGSGKRESSSCLLIVKPDDGKGSASILATGIGTKPPTEPTWNNADGLNAQAGNLSATWESNSSVSITASGSDGAASVYVDVIDPVTQKIKFTKETTGVKEFEEKITEWLTRFGKKPTWSAAVEISGEGRRCDFHNDGSKSGYKARVQGTLEVKAPQIEGETPGIPVMGGVVFVSGEASFDPFSVEAAVSFHYNEEKADPWVDPVKGSVKISAGGSVGLKATAGKEGVAEVYAKGNVGISLTGTADFDSEGRNIRLSSGSANFGELKANANVGAKAFGGEWTWWSGSITLWEGKTYTLPNLPKVIHTIPQ